MVDAAMSEAFDRISNRTNEEGEKNDLEIKEREATKRLVELRNEVWGFLATRQEEYATERIVTEIENRYYIYTTRDDIKSEIWIYDDGIYKPNGESFIKELVRKVLLHAYTPQRVNKVIAKIESDTMIDSDKFFDTRYLNEICVNNGILDLETRGLDEFTPEKIFFNKLPVDYNADAKCKNIDKFFSQVLRDKADKDILYELSGFCLHKDYFIEKAFMFLGNGRNGKGKTLSLLKTFLGVQNTCSVRLSQMEPQSSALCELHNRLVNLAGDLNNTALKDTGLFKELTGRDSVQVKRKYLRDLIFTNYAKMVFACNDLPRVYDMSEGFWSRWILLEFPYQFLPQSEIDTRSKKDQEMCKVQDPLIIDKLTTPTELSGLLNSAIDGLNRLKSNKDFSYSTGTSAVKDFWIRKSDSFTAYCLDFLEQDDEGFVSKKEIRSSFSKYCKLHHIKGTSDKNMKSVLEDMFGVIDSRKPINMANLEREWVWEGIKFTNGKDNRGIPTTLGIGDYCTSGNTPETLDKDKKLPEFTPEELESTGLGEEYKELINEEDTKQLNNSKTKN